jgi:hypothetical protein
MDTGAVAGSIILRDGGASGATVVQLDTNAIDTNPWIDIPGDGLLFETDVHMTLSNVDAVTIFYVE